MTDVVQTRGRVRVERGAKRVRAFLCGQAVADTTRPAHVWESPYYPTYYFPIEDVRAELEPTGRTHHSPSRGDGEIYDVRVGDRVAEGAATRYADSPIEALRDLVRLDWKAMDAWFEEDEEVYTHARDPYTRIDTLPSSRTIRVEVDGVVVAESSRPILLFETGLRTRYYLPKTDVRMDLLVHTDTVTHCPYKGQAEYWSIRTPAGLREDLAWSYRTPLPESQRIAGLIAFYNEKLDIYIDGIREQR
ncbi:DUF427 domain-containing protein [Allorhizocola rhizosphaerae]|uniref:DUF427 domain-containing protein n=1 Tax=Allorhizocola rhizosphaerae TaxID=1872709 RepID=UPI000E3E7A11|nr:DUF427 domain-containing protein [Allorhizocola rhizosphaerae]